MFKINLTKLLPIAACLNLYSAALASEINNNAILAKVGINEIMVGHVKIAISELPRNYGNLDEAYLLDFVLDQLIKQEIMAQSLSKDSEESSLIDFEIENQIRSLKAREAINISLNGLPEERHILQAYNEASITMKEQEEFNASHILVETENEARELRKKILSGAKFGSIASENSIGPSAERGGTLGWFGIGQMVPEFEAAVVVLEPGAISQPVRTQFGWHIIKLNEIRQKSIPPLTELRDSLTASLRQKYLDELVNQKSLDFKIEIFDSKINTFKRGFKGN